MISFLDFKPYKMMVEKVAMDNPTQQISFPKQCGFQGEALESRFTEVESIQWRILSLLKNKFISNFMHHYR